jgi:hypothetical protein
VITALASITVLAFMTSNKRGKARAVDTEDSVIQSTAILATTLKDSLRSLVQGFSVPTKTPLDEEATRRLNRVEQKVKAIDQAAKVRHEVSTASQILAGIKPPPSSLYPYHIPGSIPCSIPGS